MRILLLWSLLIAALGVSASAADVVILPGVRDNTLFEDADGDTSNGSGPAVFAGRNSQERTRRALLAFDLAGALPPDAHVESVVLTLHVSSAPDTMAQVFTLHRALGDWGEGQSSSSGGAGAPATAGDATWLHAFYPGTFWIQPGGDFDPVASATQTCGDIGFCSWSGPGLIADLTSWLHDPAGNHGWVLRGVESGPRTVRRFDSREASLPANRPTLTIQFTRSDPVAATPRTWGWLKASYRRGAR